MFVHMFRSWLTTTWVRGKSSWDPEVSEVCNKQNLTWEEMLHAGVELSSELWQLHRLLFPVDFETIRAWNLGDTRNPPSTPGSSQGMPQGPHNPAAAQG